MIRKFAARFRNAATNSLSNTLRSDIFWLAVGSFLFFLFLLFQDEHLPDIDAYFHIKLSELILKQGPVWRLPWMSAAIHADRYVDFHFLIHWLQIPFVLLSGNLITAAKLSIAFFCGCSIYMFGVLLRALDVRRRWLWVTFFVLCSPIFTGRLLFGRGITLFIGILYLHIYSMVTKKHKLNFAISFLAVWAYPGFPVLAALALLYSSAASMAAGHRRFMEFLACLAGIAAGFVLHPAFPRQFYGYWLEFAVHSLRPAGLEIISEWLPPEGGIILVGLALPGAALVFSLLKGDKPSPLQSALLILSVSIILLLTTSLKPFEYLVPVLSLFLATQKWDSLSVRLRTTAGGLLLAGSLFWSLPQLYSRMKIQFQLTAPFEEFDAAEWLESNTPLDSVVMLSWGEFPEFFFKNTHNRYLFGLNPVYAYGKDRERYFQLRSFFEGTAAKPQEILAAVGAEYAVLGKRRGGAAIQRLLQSGAKLRLSYENEEFIIFQIMSTKIP